LCLLALTTVAFTTHGAANTAESRTLETIHLIASFTLCCIRIGLLERWVHAALYAYSAA